MLPLSPLVDPQLGSMLVVVGGAAHPLERNAGRGGGGREKMIGYSPVSG
jgi:hypothetical protein